jgi:hypothetical protein
MMFEIALADVITVPTLGYENVLLGPLELLRTLFALSHFKQLFKVGSIYQTGNAIGLILPDDLPADEAQVFDVILEQLTAAAVATTSTTTTRTTVARNQEMAVNQNNQEMSVIPNNQEVAVIPNNDLQSYDEYMEFSTKLSSGMVKGKFSIRIVF